MHLFLTCIFYLLVLLIFSTLKLYFEKCFINTDTVNIEHRHQITFYSVL